MWEWIKLAPWLLLAARVAWASVKAWREGDVGESVGEAVFALVLILMAAEIPGSMGPLGSIITGTLMMAVVLTPDRVIARLLGVKRPEKIGTGTQENDRQIED
jgi:hypothetical protein